VASSPLLSGLSAFAVGILFTTPRFFFAWFAYFAVHHTDSAGTPRNMLGQRTSDLHPQRAPKSGRPAWKEASGENSLANGICRKQCLENWENREFLYAPFDLFKATIVCAAVAFVF